MLRARPSLIVAACLLAKHEAFISSGVVLTPAKRHPKLSLSPRRDVTHRIMSMAGDGPDDGKAKPTSVDPNLGVKAAW